MRTRALATTLHGIVSLVLASSAVATCGGQTETTEDPGSRPGADGGGRGADGSVDVDGWPADADLTCDSPLAAYAENLSPAVAVDYVELRTQHFDSPGGSDGGVQRIERDSERGTACAGASDRRACLADLDVVRAGSGKGWAARWGGGLWPEPHPLQFLVYTRGGEVGVVDSPQALVSFLGQIDTLEEARLVLSTASFPLTCKTTPFKTGYRREADGGWEMVTDGSDCGNTTRLRMRVSPDGAVILLARDEITTGSVCGRRPEGLVAAASGGAEVSIAAWLAEAAHLEAASVLAFRRLERELRRLGAPRELLVAARRSRADEIRHAREMAALARRFGGAPAPVQVLREIERTPFAIALENAVEGCIRETYGALVAGYQARRATDPELRSVLERIARDEARHAALAHEVAAWLEPRLDAGERAAIAEARAAALTELRAAVRRAPASDVARLAGMPEPRDARALLDLLEVQVLSRAA